MRNLILAGLLSALLMPVAGFSAETQESFQAAFDAAEEARKKASAVQSEWRDTRKIMKQAQAAAEKGDFDTAVALANKAKFQGERGAEQGEQQAQAWQDLVPQ